MAEIPVHAVSLGCPKNRADTEKFLKRLSLPARLGAEPESCRLILVNTCAFIEPAVRESVRVLLELCQAHADASAKPLFVAMGCLPLRYSAGELKKEFPEVDFWISGPDDEDGVREISRRLGGPACGPGAGVDFGRRAFGFVKIADGCDHGCAFCAIPLFKGSCASKPLVEILADAESLLDSGAREIILTAQDLLSWGRDLPKPSNILRLLEKLISLPRLKWLRLLYLHPSMISADFLKFMAGAGRPLLPYFDVPFQHSESRVLAAMGRPFKKDPRKVIEEIRMRVPEAAIRTTLMTGFPGESGEDFKNLCRFVEESRFSHLGVFAYHAEEGTRAARFADQIPMEIREERRRALMEIQAPISREWLEDFRGRTMEAAVDESAFDEWPGLYRGRVWFQAPEIDGLTYISGENLEAGAFCEAEIIDSGVYDLSALSGGAIT